MVLQHCRDRDYVGWWCNGKHCQKELSAKTGTWFQGCEQPVRTMLLFMRAWSESLTTLKFIFVRERRFAAVVQVGTKLKSDVNYRLPRQRAFVVSRGRLFREGAIGQFGCFPVATVNCAPTAISVPAEGQRKSAQPAGRY
uniref:Uncharacterized protein n=1 Tax=Trichuris muris TaxID=70415 RepID=A0A5S6QBK9_TRIMR